MATPRSWAYPVKEWEPFYAIVQLANNYTQLPQNITLTDGSHIEVSSFVSLVTGADTPRQSSDSLIVAEFNRMSSLISRRFFAKWFLISFFVFCSFSQEAWRML
jgi:hypothetical protein